MFIIGIFYGILTLNFIPKNRRCRKMFKKMKNSLSILVLAAVFVLTFAQSVFASDQPVQLTSANLYLYKYGYVGFSGNIEVNNPATKNCNYSLCSRRRSVV